MSVGNGLVVDKYVGHGECPIGVKRLTRRSLDGEHTPEPWVAFCEHFAANTPLYRALLGKNGSSWFAMRMRDYAMSVMDERERLRARLPGVKRGQEAMPREVAIAFTANLLISTLTWWLESEPRYSAREVVTWFRRFLFFGYPHALGFDPTH